MKQCRKLQEGGRENRNANTDDAQAGRQQPVAGWYCMVWCWWCTVGVKLHKQQSAADYSGLRVGGSILSNSVFITNQTFQIVLFSIHVTRFRNSQPAEHAQQQTKDKLMILSVTRRRKTSTTLEETLSEYISDVTRKENFAPCPAALFLVSNSRLMGECLCNYFTFQNLRLSCYI